MSAECGRPLLADPPPAQEGPCCRKAIAGRQTRRKPSAVAGACSGSQSGGGWREGRFAKRAAAPPPTLTGAGVLCSGPTAVFLVGHCQFPL